MRSETHRFRWDIAATAVIAAFLLLGLIASLYPVVSPRRSPPPTPEGRCLNNLKNIVTSAVMYTNDWDGHFPLVSGERLRAAEGQTWTDRLIPYAKNTTIFVCPSTRDRRTYSFNRLLSGVQRQGVADQANTLMVFESVNDSPENNNLTGDTVSNPTAEHPPEVGSLVIWPKRSWLTDHDTFYQDWPEWTRPPHETGLHVTFVDGHAKRIPHGTDFEPKFSPN